MRPRPRRGSESDPLCELTYPQSECWIQTGKRPVSQSTGALLKSINFVLHGCASTSHHITSAHGSRAATNSSILELQRIALTSVNSLSIGDYTEPHCASAAQLIANESRGSRLKCGPKIKTRAAALGRDGSNNDIEQSIEFGFKFESESE